VPQTRRGIHSTTFAARLLPRQSIHQVPPDLSATGGASRRHTGAASSAGLVPVADLPTTGPPRASNKGASSEMGCKYGGLRRQAQEGSGPKPPISRCPNRNVTNGGWRPTADWPTPGSHPQLAKSARWRGEPMPTQSGPGFRLHLSPKRGRSPVAAHLTYGTRLRPVTGRAPTTRRPRELAVGDAG
jgi:hypothetical protein